MLSGEECSVLRDFVSALTNDATSLDPLERYSHAGPANFLLDHPVLVGILEAIVVGENSNLDADSEGTLSGEGIVCDGLIRPLGCLELGALRASASSMMCCGIYLSRGGGLRLAQELASVAGSAV